MSATVTNIAQLPAVLDLTLPYAYVLSFPKITSNTGSATFELNIGDKDIWVTNFNVSAYDEQGYHFEDQLTARDKFCVQINSVDGQKLTEDPIDVYALNTLNNNQLYKGMVFKSRTKYTFVITGQGIPAAAVFNTSVKFEIDLIGYLLKQI